MHVHHKFGSDDSTSVLWKATKESVSVLLTPSRKEPLLERNLTGEIGTLT